MMGLRSRMGLGRWGIADILGIGLQVVEGTKVKWTVVWKNTSATARDFRLAVGLQGALVGYSLASVTVLAVAPQVATTTTNIVDLASLPVAVGTYDVSYYVRDQATGATLATITNTGELVVVAAAPTAQIVSASIAAA